MTKRITVILPEEAYENLRARSFEDNDGGVSVTIRNIVMEVLAKEEKGFKTMLKQPIAKQPFKSLKESAAEIKKVQEVIKGSPGLYRPAGEISGDSYI